MGRLKDAYFVSMFKDKESMPAGGPALSARCSGRVEHEKAIVLQLRQAAGDGVLGR